MGNFLIQLILEAFLPFAIYACVFLTLLYFRGNYDGLWEVCLRTLNQHNYLKNATKRMNTLQVATQLKMSLRLTSFFAVGELLRVNRM